MEMREATRGEQFPVEPSNICTETPPSYASRASMSSTTAGPQRPKWSDYAHAMTTGVQRAHGLAREDSRLSEDLRSRVVSYCSCGPVSDLLRWPSMILFGFGWNYDTPRTTRTTRHASHRVITTGTTSVWLPSHRQLASSKVARLDRIFAKWRRACPTLCTLGFDPCYLSIFVLIVLRAKRSSLKYSSPRNNFRCVWTVLPMRKFLLERATMLFGPRWLGWSVWILRR